MPDVTRLAHKFYNLIFLKSLVYDNQMTNHYQDLHLKASHVFSISNLITTYFNCYFSIKTDQKVHLSALLFMRLLSNQVNIDFEASSNEAIKLSMPLTVAYGVLPSASFAISMLFRMKNKSAREMLNKKGPSSYLWRTLKAITIHVLYLLFILVPCFLFNK